MRRDRRLNLEILEGRMMLSTAHAAAKQPAAAEVAPPLNLDGNLAVDYRSTTSTMDMYGNYYLSTPVAGNLASVGHVRGTWNVVESASGVMSDVATLQLKNPEGAFTLTFNTDAEGKVHKTATGGSFDPLAQHVSGSSGSYAHAVEQGKILFNTDKGGKDVESITLTTHPA